MPKCKTFGVGDLSLWDFWKIFKTVILIMIVLGFIYGIGYLISWGYQSGTTSLFGVEPVGSIWFQIPKWARISLVFLLALLIVRGLTSELLTAIGRLIISLGWWLEKASLKIRIALLIGLAIYTILLTYAPFVGLALMIFTVGIIGAYEDIKKEKIREMEEGLEEEED